jgi:hypothetical protein
VSRPVEGLLATLGRAVNIFGMHLMYVDESGDSGLINSPTRYFVRTGIVLHDLRWHDALNTGQVSAENKNAVWLTNAGGNSLGFDDLASRIVSSDKAQRPSHHHTFIAR